MILTVDQIGDWVLVKTYDLKVFAEVVEHLLSPSSFIVKESECYFDIKC